MSNSMDDVVQHAQAMLIIGSNTSEQHPVFGTKICQAVLRRGVKLVVADPRRIDITDFATLHIRQQPGTDVALLNGLMHIILEKGWQDQTFIDGRTENFDEFKATIDRYPPRPQPKSPACRLKRCTKRQKFCHKTGRWPSCGPWASPSTSPGSVT